jgi:hypothetical protein
MAVSTLSKEVQTTPEARSKGVDPKRDREIKQ